MKAKEIFEEVINEYEPTFDKKVAENIRNYFEENGEEFLKKFEELIPTDEEIKDQINEVINNNFANASNEDIAKHKKHLQEVYVEGKTHAEAIGLNEEFVEGLFSLGYNYYNHGKYKEAQTFFCYLTFLNDREPRYYFGAGAAFHMLEDYGSAIAFYNQCTHLDWHNPMPWYHLADCYRKVQDYPRTLMCLQNVINRTKDSNTYTNIHKRSKILYKKVVDEYCNFKKEWENRLQD